MRYINVRYLLTYFKRISASKSASLVLHTECERWNPELWRLIAIIILVNFLVCWKTRGGNCLLVFRTSYALDDPLTTIRLPRGSLSSHIQCNCI